METKDKISRLSVTEKALEVIWELEKKHGELMFYQAGGCCEGTQWRENRDRCCDRATAPSKRKPDKGRYVHNDQVSQQ